MDNQFAGQSIAEYSDSNQTGGHAMTIVGYDDNIWTDLNKNGIVDPGEKGAFKVANSWGAGMTGGFGFWQDGDMNTGITDYDNQGFYWVAYDAVRQISEVKTSKTWPAANRSNNGIFWDNSAYTITARSSYTPTLLAEFTLNTANRSSLQMGLGIGSATSTSPSQPNQWISGAIGLENINGASTPENFAGTSAGANDGTFVFDFSDLNPTSKLTSQRYFLDMNNIFPLGSTPAQLVPATLKSFELTDSSGKVLLTSDDVPLTANNKTVWSYINASQPPVTITSPSAGSQWAQGSKQAVNWTDNTIVQNPPCPPQPICVSGKPCPMYRIACPISFVSNNYDVSLVGQLSNINKTIATSIPGLSYNWTIPISQAISEPYRIQVCRTGTTVCGLSSSFTIISGAGSHQ